MSRALDRMRETSEILSLSTGSVYDEDARGWERVLLELESMKRADRRHGARARILPHEARKRFRVAMEDQGPRSAGKLFLGA